MEGKLLPPVIFNAITIVAMLYALSQIITDGPRLRAATTGITMTLQELAQESELVDEALISSFVADQEQRRGLFNEIIVVMLTAILANVAANFFGRGRQKANTARIRELEEELRGLRGD